MQNNQVFHRGMHQAVVIQTDLTEAEALIVELAEEERERDPSSFAGNSACVYFKLPYIPPYEAFHELRRLILRVHERTGLRANFIGIVAIEATQWIGHEEEEYFTVLLKYLYDHRDTWRAALILNDCTDRQVHHFLGVCTRYLTPKFFHIPIFSNYENLCRGIEKKCHAHSGSISTKACEMLANAILQSSIKEIKSLTLISRIVEEALFFCKDTGNLSAEAIQAYLSASDTMLNLFKPKQSIDEWRYPIEEVLQL